jgi:hypothetical protein
MRPWFAALAALCVCAPAWPQTPTAGTSSPGTQAPATAAPGTAAPRTAPQGGTAHLTRPGVTAAAAATPAPPAPAPLYRIELVVFRALSPIGGPESWAAEGPVAAGAPPPSGPAPSAPTQSTPAQSTPGQSGPTQSAPTQSSPPTPSDGVRLLPASEFQLDGVAARLRSSGRYLPIAHAAWWQSASPWGRPTEIPIESLGLAAQGLTGTLSLQRGQFLHLELSLDYAQNDPPAALGAGPGTVFSLHQTQRVLFYQRSYFDHPAFGVIALVTPAQTPRRARK